MRAAFAAFFFVLVSACGDDSASDFDGSGLCGNGFVDSGEACDGTALGGESCEAMGFGGGTLGCSSTCDAFDDSGCESPPICGNGALDPGEVCDGELTTATCEGLGFGPGILGCDRCVASDTSMCGCRPTTCEAQNANCGQVPDGCGGVLECNSPVCDAEWLTCGGAGTPNRCGSECLSSCPAGSMCSELGICTFIDPLVVDVTFDMVSFRFLVDGEAPEDNSSCTTPQSTVGSGTAVNTAFTGGVWNGSIRCGTNWTSDPIPLPPGRYGVSVRGRAGATNLPPIPGEREVEVVAGGPSVVDVDLPFSQVAGRLVIGGAAPVETAACTPGSVAATIELSAATRSMEIPVLCGTGFTFDTRLFHGVYQVSVAPATGRSNLGPRRVELPELEVNAPIPALELEVSDQSVEVSGSVTWGGIVPTPTALCSRGREAARVTFFDRTGNFVAFGPMACDGDFRYNLRVLPGEYSVQVRGAFQEITDLPNFNHLVGTLRVREDTAFDVDIPRRTYEGRVTIDGAALVENDACTGDEPAGRLRIQDRVIEVRCGGGAYGPIDLVPADVPCSVCTTPTISEVAATFIPSGVDLENTARGAVDLQVAGDPFDINFVVNEPLLNVDVRLTLDARLPAENCAGGDVGQLTLRSIERGGVVATNLVACGSEFSTVFEVPRGTYQLEGRGNEMSDMPPFFRIEETFVVDRNTSLTRDVTTRLFSGQVLVNGELPLPVDCDVGEEFVLGFSDSNERLGITPQVELPYPCDGNDLSSFGPLRLPVGLYTVSVGPGLFGTRRTGTNVPDYRYNVVGRFEVR